VRLSLQTRDVRQARILRDRLFINRGGAHE
jgi:hypothetical protein